MNQQRTNLDQGQAEALIRGKRLAFLVGAPRSGTTWLQLMLSQSPSVVTAQETHLFDSFLRSMLDEWYSPRMTGSGDIGVKQVLSQDEFTSLLRSVSSFVLAKIAQAKPSAAVVLEKTPQHVHRWRDILALWPDAHFIHLMRDPRSVVASMRIASKSGWAPGWRSISADSEGWVSAVKDGQEIRSATQNWQQVTFEELKSDGPATLMRLLRGLGVKASVVECQRYVEDCNIGNLQAGKLDNAPFQISNEGESYQSYRRGETESWRVELSEWEIALVERLAGPLMLELGFIPTNGRTARSALVALGCNLIDFGMVTKRRLRRFTGSARRRL
jgi:Sulfotransferase family